MQKIYIVEDDDNIRELVSYALTSADYEAHSFESGESFNKALKTLLPDLVLLDIMLPGEGGISILKSIKSSENTANIPVIMLTAKGSEFDRIKGLELGADDYVTKPFSVMELISRIRAVLRRSSSPENAPDDKCREYTVDGVKLLADKRSVIINDEEVALTFKEFELLHFMMQNEGYVLSRNKILDKIWGFDYVGETRTVDMHIKTLRQKLKGCSGIIKTVRNVGYKVEE